MLAATIRKDNLVKGITVGSTECKLGQHHSDFRGYVLKNRLSAPWLYWKKNWWGSNQIICSDKILKWADCQVKPLGVWFYIDCEECNKKNNEEKVHKVEDIKFLNNWRNKRLTWIGKSAVIKAPAVSQFVCKIAERNEQSSFKVILDNKGDKIKRTEMIADF